MVCSDLYNAGAHYKHFLIILNHFPCFYRLYEQLACGQSKKKQNYLK